MLQSQNANVSKGDEFHHITLESCIRYLDRGIESGLITQDDYTQIMTFINQKRGMNHVSISRIRKLCYILTSWRRFIGEYRQNTFDDITAGLTKMYAGTTSKGRAFAQATLNDHITILKMFYRWLIDEGRTTHIRESQISKIRTSAAKSKYNEDDVLTPEQIQTLIDRAPDLETKVMFALLYEGALRSGELGTLTWSQLEYHKTHVNLIIQFKTAYQRQIPIILYKDLLISWRHIHEDAKPSEYVFVNRFNKPYEYAALNKKLLLLQGTFPGASIQKRLDKLGWSRNVIPFRLHQIRHTRITHMIQSGMSKETVSLIAWGQINAHELDRYAHLFGSVDKMVLAHYGITPAEPASQGILTPTVCPDCGYLNQPGRKFCQSCLKPLTIDAAREYDNISSKLNADMLNRFIVHRLEHPDDY